jgi:hypothetical protein
MNRFLSRGSRYLVIGLWRSVTTQMPNLWAYKYNVHYVGEIGNCEALPNIVYGKCSEYFHVPIAEGKYINMQLVSQQRVNCMTPTCGVGKF